jgi:hypothetical protein
LRKLRLFEYSLVTVPANQMAVVTGAKGWPVAGLPFDEHSERMVSVVQEFVARAEDRTDARFKVGRILSDANERAIEQAVTVLQDLLTRSRASRTREDAASDPPAIDTAKAQEVEAIFAAFQELSTRLGVPL